LAVNLATPTAAASASVAATPAPVASPAASAVAETSPSPEATATPEVTPTPEATAAAETPASTSTLEEVTRFVVIVIVLFQIIYGWVSFLLAAKRLSRRPPRGGGGPSFADGKPSEAEEMEADEVEAPR
jgi:hypothetical protein